MQDQQKIIPLRSSNKGKFDSLIENQTITPLIRKEAPKQEVIKIDEDVAKFVEQQNNRVVAFLINWIKTIFAKMIIDYLNTEFKPELIKELKK